MLRTEEETAPDLEKTKKRKKIFGKAAGRRRLQKPDLAKLQ